MQLEIKSKRNFPKQVIIFCKNVEMVKRKSTPIRGLSALTDRKNATPVDYDELTTKADQAWQDSMTAKEKPLITKDNTSIEVEGHIGTWYVIDTAKINGTEYFLL